MVKKAILGMFALALSATPVKADNYGYRKCYCESPNILAVVRKHIYGSDRLDREFSWDSKGMIPREGKVPRIGVRCENVDDPSTCVDVTDFSKFPDLVGPRNHADAGHISCTREESPDGRTFEICGDAVRVVLNNKKKFLQRTKRTIDMDLDCTDLCQAAIPEEPEVVGACGMTDTSHGPHRGEIIPVFRPKKNNGREMEKNDAQCKIWKYKYFNQLWTDKEVEQGAKDMEKKAIEEAKKEEKERKKQEKEAKKAEKKADKEAKKKWEKEG